MKIVGIILEANPFHNGHRKLVNEVKNNIKPDILIGLTTTSFSMRGDLSVLSKKEKTEILLDNGFDLILEYPVCLSLNRSDIFSKNAIEILKKFKITHLAFGSENTNIKELSKMAEIINSEDFIESVKTKKNTSIKKIQTDILSDLPETLLLPNSTLSVNYLNDLKNTGIIPYIIKRETDYNSLHLKNESASSYRNALLNNVSLEKALNYKVNIDYKSSLNNLMNIVKYKLLVEKTKNKNDVEGIGNYIVNNGDFSLDFDSFTSKLSNSKYTKTRIKRYLVELLVNNNNLNKTSYLRILGFNQNGLKYINSLECETKMLCFSNPNEIKDNELYKDTKSLYQNEESYSLLYSVITNNQKIIEDEYKFPIKR